MVRRALATDRAGRQTDAREFAETAVTLLADSSRDPRPVVAGPPSIVVLPLRNLSSDPDTDFFADGVAEEISSDLSQLDELTVISRTTAMQYRGTDLSVPEIARDLGVRYVLEGSVRKAGDAVRVTIQVIEAASDRNLWGGKFSGTMSDVFEIQERVAREVADALQLSFSDEQSERIRRRRLEDPRELELFMRVRHEVWRADAESLVRAEALLAAASELVAESPRLMAIKGEILFQSVNLGFSEESGRFEEAQRLAERAIDADPECAPAHALLGWINGASGRMVEAIEYAERAYELDPSEATAMLGIVCFGSALGSTRAIDPDAVAQALIVSDPLWPPAHVALWWREMSRGAWQASLEATHAALRLEASPLFGLFHTLSLANAGMSDDAIEASAVALHEPGMWSHFVRGIHYGLKGDAEAARAQLTPEVRDWSRHDGQYCWHVAQVLSFSGDHEVAVEWLGFAVDAQLWNWRLIGEYDQLLAGLHGREDFEAVVRRARDESERLAMRWRSAATRG